MGWGSRYVINLCTILWLVDIEVAEQLIWSILRRQYVWELRAHDHQEVNFFHLVVVLKIWKTQEIWRYATGEDTGERSVPGKAHGSCPVADLSASQSLEKSLLQHLLSVLVKSYSISPASKAIIHWVWPTPSFYRWKKGSPDVKSLLRSPREWLIS